MDLVLGLRQRFGIALLLGDISTQLSVNFLIRGGHSLVPRKLTCSFHQEWIKELVTHLNPSTGFS